MKIIRPLTPLRQRMLASQEQLADNGTCYISLKFHQELATSICFGKRTKKLIKPLLPTR